MRGLLAEAGVEVGGDRPFDIEVHDRRFYARVLAEAHLGLGESYMDGWWDCRSLDQLLDRVLRARLEHRVGGDWKLRWHVARSRLFNLQKPSRAGIVARRHYDLGYDFYRAMLGPTMQYTCAYWNGAADLEQAQEAKLDLVCRKAGLEPGTSVLELGCGWGGFARWAAEKYGARVTAYNVSGEQVRFARETCAGLPVEIVHDDYRAARGSYDRVVSVGIMEHVGHKNYRTYMEVADRCLAADGVAFVHTIGSNVSTTTSNAWFTRYIFPNGMLPSIVQLGAAMEHRFVLEDWHNLGPHYDRTLMAWHRNFCTAWPTFAERFGERFRRPCAGWTTPEVLAALEIGPRSYPYGLTHVKRIHFHLGGARIPVRVRQLAFRRCELDDWLLRRSGVSVVRHRVHEVTRHSGGFVIDGKFRCRFVVGAGGTACPVYRGLFADVAPRALASLVVALEAEVPCAAPDPDCHLWFGDRGLAGYSWYLPKDGGFVNIGVGGIALEVRRGGGIHGHWEQLLRRLARLGLTAATEAKPHGYAYYLRQRTPVGQRCSAFLVGDAAGLATLDMGEGIGAAVASGALAAEAIADGAPYSPSSLPRSSIPQILTSRFRRSGWHAAGAGA